MTSLEWNSVGRAAWQGLLSHGRAGLQQGWSYGEALRASGVPVHRAVMRDGAGQAVCCLQVAERRVCGPIGAGFLLRGPVWLHDQLGRADEPEMLTAIRARLGRRMLIWAPEIASGHTGRSVISGYSTSWIDLQAGSNTLRRGLAGDWRSCLRQAETSGLTVRRLANSEATAWLVDRNEAHRRAVGYRGPTRQFLTNLAAAAQEARELLLLLAFERDEPLAGIMILRHGTSATYEVSYVSSRGRELRATHLLLWRAVETLIRKQVRWLDLGGIATDRSPGIARFKLGMGGTLTTLPGTFLVRGDVGASRWLRRGRS